jgi:glycosyltransferase involved in cell wall biosynthesis
VVVLQRELFPFGPPFLERKLLRGGVPVVHDIDDAMHIRPDHFRTLSHALHDFRKVDEIARGAREVVVSSATLEEWARPLARRVTRIPTPVDTNRFHPLRDRPVSDPPVVGWTGTAGNLPHLDRIIPALAEASRRKPFRLRIIGERPLIPIPGSIPDSLSLEFVPWSLEGEPEEVARFDVGLMPISDTPYARAKAGYKALVYMACGVPPLLSPVGTNREILDDGVEGVFAGTPTEWVDGLLALLGDIELRRRIGERARARVVRERSQDAVFPAWLEVLRTAAGSGNR